MPIQDFPLRGRNRKLLAHPDVRAAFAAAVAADALTIEEKPDPLAVQVPDRTVNVLIEFTDDAGSIVLTLPEGEENIGHLCLVNVEITADQGTATKVNVVSDLMTETDVGNGLHLYLCIAAGSWLPLSLLYAPVESE